MPPSLDYLAAMRALTRSVELGSFSRAAAESGVKASTISRQVAALEADLGAALLNRSTRRLNLTEAGRAFHDRATAILRDVDDARLTTSALNSRPQGLLRLSLPGAFGRLHVLPAMAAFLAAHPEIRVDLDLADERVDLIEAGIDLALRVGSLPDSGLKARRLAAHRRVLCASPDALRQEPPADPSALAGRSCLVPLTGPGQRWYFRPRVSSGEGDRLDGQVTVRGRLCTTDLEAMRQAALAGLGIALLPDWLVATDLRAGRLVIVLDRWRFATVEDFDQAIWAVYPPKKVVSPKVRAFIDHMQRHLATLPGFDDAPQPIVAARAAR